MRSLALALLVAAAFSANSAGAAVKPRIGTYAGSAPGTSREHSRLDIEVVKRSGSLRVRLLDLRDGCGSQLLNPPLGLGPISDGVFDYKLSGSTTSTGYNVELKGTFANRRRATATLTGAVGDLFPPLGVQPGTANICSDSTVFALKFLPDGL